MTVADRSQVVETIHGLLEHIHTPTLRRIFKDSDGDLSFAQWALLGLLSRGGQPTMTQLAQYTMTSKPNLTMIINRMIRAGLVRRTARDDDRRVAVVTITAKGKRELTRVRSGRSAVLLKALEALDDSEIEEMGQAVDTIARLIGKLHRDPGVTL